MKSSSLIKSIIFIFFLMSTGLPMLTLSAQISSNIVHKESNGFLKVEAEHFYKQTKSDVRQWYVVSSEFKTTLKQNDPALHLEGASAGAYLEILPDTRTNHSEELIPGENFSNKPGEIAILHYKISVSTPGRYYIWVRAYSTGSEDNGIHVGLDGTWPESGARMQWCPGKNSWYWDSKQRTQEIHCGVPGLIYFDIEEAGEHEVQFSMREDGFEMDQWLMTTDRNFKPGKKMGGETEPVAFDWDKIGQDSPEVIFIKAPDFENVSGKFYQDKSWLAINPNQDKEAEAKVGFSGPSDLYDLVIFGVGENDGRSSYSIAVNGFNQGNFQPPLSSNMFEEGATYCKVFKDVQVNTGDVISLKSEIGSKDGKEYSRGRWSGVALVKLGQGERLLDKAFNETANSNEISISGDLKKWHKITLTFDGPPTSELDAYNPFMNYRLTTTFTHDLSGKRYVVPGYFAADGYAGQNSSSEGDKWRVHFAPDEVGTWQYSVDFRKGNWVAVSSKKEAGISGAFMDGATGEFAIDETDKQGRDFRGKGRLQYVGERYLKFADSGEYFLKQGPDAPENFLSFQDFDGTFHNDGHKDNMIKTWSPHLIDWKAGDPTWKNGKGKAIIGALNYLAAKGLNAVSFLTNNIVGDDQNVFMYTDYDSYDRIDVSKMDQWEILFEHAQKLGLFLHFKLLEVENQGLLDNGGVGAQTKLYYRELMARFGHHLALNWNLGEENGEWMKDHVTPPQETEQRLAMTYYFKNNDPYHHHLVIHNGNPFDDLLGPNSGLTGPSVQTSKPDFSQVHKAVLRWLRASEDAGFIWAVAVDEPGDATHSLLPDEEDPDHDNARRNALWGTLMAGGWGNEWYFGYKHAHSDLTCEDYRSRDLFWDQTQHALNFFKEQKLPFWEMKNRNDLVGNVTDENTAYCLAKEDEVYVVYLNSVATATLDLTNANGNFEVQWYNPKEGNDIQQTALRQVAGGSRIELGQSPNGGQEDWTILIRKTK